MQSATEMGLQPSLRILVPVARRSVTGAYYHLAEALAEVKVQLNSCVAVEPRSEAYAVLELR